MIFINQLPETYLPQQLIIIEHRFDSIDYLLNRPLSHLNKILMNSGIAGELWVKCRG